ncbi:MAG TPA: helix-turn-helix transcriptional regulator [Silvibacterium sp.]|nr:helix-turn-helix transcriptional regulator [Silvibacterium sp.]
MKDPAPPAPDAAEKWEVQLRRGSLELAILAALWDGRLYGLEILRHLESNSDLIVVEGTAYPLLTRLRSLGLVESEWVESESGHPRKYYRLTPAGRQRALEMARIWARFSGSMTQLLTPLSKEVNNKNEAGRRIGTP